MSVKAGVRISSAQAPADVVRLVRIACKRVVPAWLTELGYRTREGHIACEHLLNPPRGATAPLVIQLVVPSAWEIAELECDRLAMNMELTLSCWRRIRVEVMVARQDERHEVNITDLEAPLNRLPTAVAQAQRLIQVMRAPVAA